MAGLKSLSILQSFIMMLFDEKITVLPNGDFFV